MSLPRDNVVPIDDAAALVLARRRTRFRWFVATLGAVWLSALVPVLVLTPLPPLAPFVVMAGLMILAEHRFILFDDETSMSASIIVGVASVFVFADTSPLAGPMLVASTAGLYGPQLRRGELAKVATNGSAASISALAASAFALGSTGQTTNGLPSLTLIAVISVVTYWCTNNIIVAAYLSNHDGRPFARTAGLLVSSDTGILWWAAVCAVGISASRGNFVAQLAIVLIVLLHRIAHASLYAQRMRAVPRLPEPFARVLIPVATWAVAVAVITASGMITPPALTASAVIVALGTTSNKISTTENAFAATTAGLLAMTSGPPMAAALAIGVLIASALGPRGWSARSAGLTTSGCAAALALSFVGEASTVELALLTAFSVATLAWISAQGPTAVRLLSRCRDHHPLVTLGVLVPSFRDVAIAAVLAALGSLSLVSAPLAVMAIAACVGARSRIATPSAQGSSANASR